MFTLQLFIKDNDGSDVRIDLFKDESVTLTQAIQNVRDIGSVFTDFTRTFTVPASPNTNKLFKHFYNSDIVSNDNLLASDFDAGVRRDSVLELNHTPFKKGQIRLDGVNMKEGKPSSYKITFFGNTVKLSTLMGDDNLSSLDLSAQNTVYTAGVVKSKLIGVLNDVITPLITHTRRLVFNSSDGGSNPTYSGVVDNIAAQNPNVVGDNRGLSLKQLKFAIRVHKIIEAIQAKYNLTFSDDFLNTTNTPYYNLYLWLHRKSGDVGTDPQIAEPFTQQITTFQTGPFLISGGNYDSQINSNGTTLEVSGTDNINFTLDIVPNDNSINYTIDAFLDGEKEYTKSGTGQQQLEMIGTFVPSVVGPGDYTFFISTTSSTQLVVTGTITMTVIGKGGSQLPEASYTLTFSSLTVAQSQSFNISEEMPKIKCIDFLSGIFKMFNLTAFVEDDGTIKIQTLDSFYSAGVTRNITDFVDITESKIDTALPFKEIDFRFQGRQSFLADTHEKIFNLEWGTETFNRSDVTRDGTVYKIELPFEHFKFQRLLDLNDQTGATISSVQFGWSVNLDQNPFVGKPLLFYPIRISGGSEIQLKDFNGVAAGTTTTYIIPSNVTTLLSSGQSIHFGTENHEYIIPDEETVTKNLFSEYYRNYISDVFDSKNRLSRFTAYLPAKILLNLSLADRLEINQKSYKINSISTDMENGKSDLELINNFNA